jgi:serine/threonine protein phosphatase PrpC
VPLILTFLTIETETTLDLILNFLVAYFARDKVNGDANLGVFGVFDGHGGRQVADHCAERIPDELRKEL